MLGPDNFARRGNLTTLSKIVSRVHQQACKGVLRSDLLSVILSVFRYCSLEISSL